MQSKTVAMGDVRVIVEWPDGLSEPDLSVGFGPATAEEFEACVEATGGYAGLHLPREAARYRVCAHRLGGGLTTRIYEPMVEYEGRIADLPKVDHPFFGPRLERQRAAETPAEAT